MEKLDSEAVHEHDILKLLRELPPPTGQRQVALLKQFRRDGLECRALLS